MSWITHQGFHIDLRHYNNATQQTTNGFRTERTNCESLQAHLMVAGQHFFDINNESTSLATTWLLIAQLLHIDPPPPAHRVPFGHSRHRRLPSHKLSCIELLCMGSPVLGSIAQVSPR